MLDVFKFRGEYMNDLSLPFYATTSEDELGVYGSITKAFVDVWSNNEVDPSGFIFKCHEHNTLGGARSLPEEHDAGNRNNPSQRATLFVLHCCGMKHALLSELLAEKGHRMSFERKAEHLVIPCDLINLVGPWQRHLVSRWGDLVQKRKWFAVKDLDFPEGMPAVEMHRTEGVGSCKGPK
jgi:hypothetical protein